VDVNKVRAEFPILQKKVNGKPFIYFDSACTTLKPKPVIDAVVAYYTEYTGCAGRSIHKFATKTTENFEKAREKIAKFINAKRAEEVIWTKNTTEAINLVSHSFKFNKGDKVMKIGRAHV